MVIDKAKMVHNLPFTHLDRKYQDMREEQPRKWYPRKYVGWWAWTGSVCDYSLGMFGLFHLHSNPLNVM